MRMILKLMSKARRYFCAIGLGGRFDGIYQKCQELSVKRDVLKFDKLLYKYRNIQGLGLSPMLVDTWHIMRNDGSLNSWTLDGVYYSQCGQDRFIDMLFQNPSLKSGRGSGTFLDIGGNHPIKINNTYYFERQGWKGLAFEPLPDLCKEWEEHRSTPCLNIALGIETKEIEFIQYDKHYLSHRSDVDEGASVEAVKSSKAEEVQRIIVKQRNLNDILDEYDMHIIDYCSLDVEGCELEILKSIDYNINTIKVFTIENEDDPDTIYEIRKFLNDKGFWIMARLCQDDVFVNKEFFYFTDG